MPLTFPFNVWCHISVWNVPEINCGCGIRAGFFHVGDRSGQLLKRPFSPYMEL